MNRICQVSRKASRAHVGQRPELTWGFWESFQGMYGAMIPAWSGLLEVIGMTMAGSLFLRLVLSTNPGLRWLAPAIWLYLPLFPLLVRRLPLAPHGYSVRQWSRTATYPLLGGAGILGLCVLVVSGWRLLTTSQPLPAPHLPSFEAVLGQLMVVAIPEELFFRGYIQERVRFWARQHGWAEHRVALLLSALLFTLAHLVVFPGWQRVAVFFPGCVMGWLRTASKGLLAPTLFHWLANLLVPILHL